MKVSRRIHLALWHIGAAAWAAFERRALPRRAHSTHGAITLRVATGLDDPAGLVKAAAAGLDLVGEVEPRRLARMQRDVAALVIADLRRVYGAYSPGSRICYLSTHTLRERSVAEVALVIAHEATHARLDRLHLVKWWPPLWRRIEHRCLREEFSFATRLPRDRFPEIDSWIAERVATARPRAEAS